MKRLICLGFILLFFLSACSSGGNSQSAAEAALEATRVAQYVAATAQAEANAILASAAPPTQKPTDTIAAPPTETATPEPTATPTEVPMVKAVANVNASCRSGPDKVFPLVEMLNAGTSTLVIGQYSGNGQWWKVRTDTGKECWVLASNTTTTGDLSIVAMLESPPTLTPVPPPTWNGYWIIRFSDSDTNPDTNASTYTILISQNKDVVSGSFTAKSGSVSFSGTVSADGMTVTGSLGYNPYGNFTFKLVRVSGNLNQFKGKFYRANNPGIDGVFCGGINGTTYPSPCRP